MKKPEASKSNIPGYVRGRITSGVVTRTHDLTMDVTMDIGIGRLRRLTHVHYLISDHDVYKG
jgi:hypothetical protein